MRIFISYSHLDEQYASRLLADIKSQNIDIWIDKKSIKPGDIWLKEIDEGLSNRQIDYVLGIVTGNYMPSTGGIEAYAKISEGLGKKDIKFIPLFFEDINKIDSVIIKAIHGFKFNNNYERALLDLVKYLKSEDGESAAELLAKIESEHSRNPFRRIRAEFFENDYSLAKAFAIPEQARYDLVSGKTPLFIFGGRGSGKTMILKSLTPEVIASRFQVKNFKEAKEKDVNYFGIYVRLVRGSFSLANNDTILKLGFLSLSVPTPDYALYKALWDKITANVIDDPVVNAGLNAAQRIFLDELNYKILAVLITKLKYLQNNSPSILIDSETEEKIVTLIMPELTPSV